MVVVGYGVQKKSDVTGAIARVGEKELKSMPVKNAPTANTDNKATKKSRWNFSKRRNRLEFFLSFRSCKCYYCLTLKSKCGS